MKPIMVLAFVARDRTGFDSEPGHNANRVIPSANLEH